MQATTDRTCEWPAWPSAPLRLIIKSGAAAKRAPPDVDSEREVTNSFSGNPPVTRHYVPFSVGNGARVPVWLGDPRVGTL